MVPVEKLFFNFKFPELWVRISDKPFKIRIFTFLKHSATSEKREFE